MSLKPLTLLSILFVSISLSACGKEHVELPKGLQEVTGILHAVPLSATRRGTHVLEISSKPFTFVESEMPLRALEGLQVTARGTFEENLDPSLLPVLIATEIYPRVRALRQWKQPTLGITLNVPEEWNGESDGQMLRFSSSGSLKPILIVEASELEELPNGEQGAVGGESARTLRSASGQTVFVKRPNGSIVRFSYTYRGEEEERVEQDYEFRQIVLRSVVFGGAPSSASGISTGTGSSAVLGQPCGGDAGILCPSGQYCEVTDSQTDIGRCKVVR